MCDPGLGKIIHQTKHPTVKNPKYRRNSKRDYNAWENKLLIDPDTHRGFPKHLTNARMDDYYQDFLERRFQNTPLESWFFPIDTPKPAAVAPDPDDHALKHARFKDQFDKDLKSMNEQEDPHSPDEFEPQKPDPPAPPPTDPCCSKTEPEPTVDPYSVDAWKYCEICLDDYGVEGSIRLILPCTCIYCNHCLKKMYDHKDSKQQIRCPKCRQSYSYRHFTDIKIL